MWWKRGDAEKRRLFSLTATRCRLESQLTNRPRTLYPLDAAPPKHCTVCAAQLRWFFAKGRSCALP